LLTNQHSDDDDNACTWYFINIVLDTTIGVVFEWFLVRMLEIFARAYEIDTLISGCYYTRKTLNYDDYNINYCIWAVQTLVWCMIASMMKVFVYIVMMGFTESLKNFGNYFLGPLSLYPRLELIVVMIVIPFILNCFQVNSF